MVRPGVRAALERPKTDFYDEIEEVPWVGRVLEK